MSKFVVVDTLTKWVVYNGKSYEDCVRYVDCKAFNNEYDYVVYPTVKDGVMFDVKDYQSGKVYYRTNDYGAALVYMEENDMESTNYHIEYTSNDQFDSKLEKKVKPVVDGVGTDAPITVNSKGGKQSASPYRMDLVPPLALLAASRVLEEGARKYGERNWENVDKTDHINHALVHIYSELAGDTSDDHLQHALVRLMMALELHIKNEMY